MLLVPAKSILCFQYPNLPHNVISDTMRKRLRMVIFYSCAKDTRVIPAISVSQSDLTNVICCLSIISMHTPNGQEGGCVVIGSQCVISGAIT